MLADLDAALHFLRDFHATALKNVQGLRVDDPDIPNALRKVYATFGEPGASGIINAQDSLSGPSELRRVGDFVHFLSENQACWSCAYHVNGGVDPAVYLFGDEPEPEKQSDSLSKFLVTYLLEESVMSAPHSATQEEGILPEEALNELVEPLWLDAVYSQPNPTHWFYCCKAARILIMRFDGDFEPWLWMGSYEDRWESVLKDCKDGYLIQGPTGDERRVHCTSPRRPPEKRLPKWLSWLG